MKTCLLLSDTHGQLDITKKIIAAYPHMDYYLHLGDVGFALQELSKFIVVKGNHDQKTELPMLRILEIEGHRILCTHGFLFDEETIQEVMSHDYPDGEDMMNACMNILHQKLLQYTLEHHCDILLFGHTHHQCNVNLNGIALINPGSVSFGTPRSGFATMQIAQDKISVEFHSIEEIVN